MTEAVEANDLQVPAPRGDRLREFGRHADRGGCRCAHHEHEAPVGLCADGVAIYAIESSLVLAQSDLAARETHRLMLERRLVDLDQRATEATSAMVAADIRRAEGERELSDVREELEEQRKENASLVALLRLVPEQYRAGREARRQGFAPRESNSAAYRIGWSTENEVEVLRAGARRRFAPVRRLSHTLAGLATIAGLARDAIREMRATARAGARTTRGRHADR